MTIVYTIENLYGDNATIVGTITTDGTLGPLSPVNFRSYDITITSGQLSHTFTQSDTGVLIGSTAYATPDDLMFNFGGGGVLGFSEGQGTGWLVNWQSGCNSGECGQLVAVLGFDHVISSPAYGSQTLSIAHHYSNVPVPVAGSGPLAILLLLPLLLWSYRYADRCQRR